MFQLTKTQPQRSTINKYIADANTRKLQNCEKYLKYLKSCNKSALSSVQASSRSNGWTFWI